jgi:hypothetical protein
LHLICTDICWYCKMSQSYHSMDPSSVSTLSHQVCRGRKCQDRFCWFFPLPLPFTVMCYSSASTNFIRLYLNISRSCTLNCSCTKFCICKLICVVLSTIWGSHGGEYIGGFWVVVLCSLVEVYQTTWRCNPEDSHLCCTCLCWW